MTMPKKGSRNIVVDGVGYRWRTTGWKKLENWRPADAGLIDDKWIAQAQKFGLGAVADVEFLIHVETLEDHRSQIVCTYQSLVVDGFLGPEQFTQISPGFIRRLIEVCLDSGWKPHCRGDHRVTVVENTGSMKRPGLLILPGLATSSEDYKGKIFPVQLLWERPSVPEA